MEVAWEILRVFDVSRGKKSEGHFSRIALSTADCDKGPSGRMTLEMFSKLTFNHTLYSHPVRKPIISHGEVSDFSETGFQSILSQSRRRLRCNYHSRFTLWAPCK